MKSRDIDSLIRERLNIFDEIDKLIIGKDIKTAKLSTTPEKTNAKIDFSTNNMLGYNLIVPSRQTSNPKQNSNPENIQTILRGKHLMKLERANNKKLSFNLSSTGFPLMNTAYRYLNKEMKSKSHKYLHPFKSISKEIEISNDKSKINTKDLTSQNPISFTIQRSPTSSTLKVSDSRNTLFSRSFSSKMFNDLISITENNKIRKRNHNNSGFHPLLNKNSLKIAEKLGNSFDRLTKSRKKVSKSTRNDSFSNHSFLTNYTKISKSSINLATLGQSLYDRAMSSLDKKRSKIKQKKLEDENSYKKYSFRPDLSLSRSKSKERYNSEENFHKGKIYERHQHWINKKEAKIKKLKQSIDDQENEELTLQPELFKKSMRDDERFIKSNVRQIMSYIDRMKKSETKKVDHQKVCSQVYHYGTKYTGKKTIIKEFNLSSSNFKENGFHHLDSSVKERSELRELTIKRVES